MALAARAHPIARLQVGLKGARARGRAGLVQADQVGGRGQPVEVVGVERRRPVGVGQRRVRVGPRLAIVGSPAALERVIHA